MCFRASVELMYLWYGLFRPPYIILHIYVLLWCTSYGNYMCLCVCGFSYKMLYQVKSSTKDSYRTYIFIGFPLSFLGCLFFFCFSFRLCGVCCNAWGCVGYAPLKHTSALVFSGYLYITKFLRLVVGWFCCFFFDKINNGIKLQTIWYARISLGNNNIHKIVDKNAYPVGYFVLLCCENK